jgi:hypothetical protein
MAAEQAERRAAQLDAPEHRRGRRVATGVALAAAQSRGAKFRGTKDEPHGPPASLQGRELITPGWTDWQSPETVETSVRWILVC